MTGGQERNFEDDILSALAPIAGECRVGTALRYSGRYREIRQARHEDDATLPQGEWERPLKKADWPQVARLCLSALQYESKDLQIAAWLCEAWIRLHGVRGMSAGVRLLDGMVTHFWTDAYPPHQADDEARLGIFEWLRDTLLTALTMHVVLLEGEDVGEPALTLDDWQRVVAEKTAPSGRERPDRATLLARVRGARLDALIAMRHDLVGVLDLWARFARRLDETLGAQGPSLGAVADRVVCLTRAVDSLTGSGASVTQACADPATGEGDGSDSAIHETHPRETPPAHALSLPEEIRSREQAYAVLARAAAYLREHEPHSPTPYLIERALTWGRMPLPELMDEVLSEDGGLRWYAGMLGLAIQRE